MQRFWSKVNKTNTCWEWTAALDNKGYGRIGINGKIMLAHRVAYILKFGSIPSKMCVLHKCDNPLCVNIDHLFLGTQLDNIKDRDNKGRGVQRRGEQSGKAKLSDIDVADIRKSKGISTKKLAQVFGVSQGHIYKVINFEQRVMSS